MMYFNQKFLNKICIVNSADQMGEKKFDACEHSLKPKKLTPNQIFRIAARCAVNVLVGKAFVQMLCHICSH